MRKYMLIPVDELEELEKTREQVWQLVEKLDGGRAKADTISNTIPITSLMWRIAHKRYESILQE